MDKIPFDPYDFFGYIASGLVMVVLAQVTLGFPKVFGADLKMFDLAVTILAVYIAGQAMAGPAKWFFEDVVVNKVLGNPAKNLVAAKPAGIGRFIFPGFYQPLPAATCARLAARVGALKLVNATPEGIFLAIRYAPEMLKDEKLMAKLDTFLDLYGFSRNVSFCLIFSAVCFAADGHARGSWLLMQYAMACVVGGLLLFYRYLSLYRQYSYELFNCYACGSDKDAA